MIWGIKRKVIAARKRVDAEITDLRGEGGLCARGLASEGYAGGYRDALDDVLLLCNGCWPCRRDYWREDDRGKVRKKVKP